MAYLSFRLFTYCLVTINLMLAAPFAMAQQETVSIQADTLENEDFGEMDMPEITWRDLRPVDSFTFMKDDGEFSDAEKDEEAFYIYATCQQNHIQNTFYNCACIAGAFRAARDDSVLVPQGRILSSLYRNQGSSCANTLKIAGTAYGDCQSYMNSFHERESEREKERYCQCVANTVANEFTSSPQLDLGYINNIRVGAMQSCQTPRMLN